MKGTAIRVEPISIYLERCRNGLIYPVIVVGETVRASGPPPFDPEIGEIKRVPSDRASGHRERRLLGGDQVQSLEDALGVRLLNRTTRRTSLTEAGRDYYGRCVRILQDLKEADEAAGAQPETPRGQHRCYCHESIARFVAPVVSDFLTRYPEAAVDFRAGCEVIDLVKVGFDVAVSPVPPADATLVRRRLGTLSSIVCASPLYLQKHPVSRSPADLARHNCLRLPYAPPSPDEWLFQDPVGNPVVARASLSLITNSTETRRAAAAAGVGLVRTAPFLMADLLASGALVPVLSDYRVQGFEINAFYPCRRHLSAKVRVFIDMLVDRFGEQERSLGPDAG